MKDRHGRVGAGGPDKAEASTQVSGLGMQADQEARTETEVGPRVPAGPREGVGAPSLMMEGRGIRFRSRASDLRLHCGFCAAGEKAAAGAEADRMSTRPRTPPRTTAASQGAHRSPTGAPSTRPSPAGGRTERGTRGPWRRSSLSAAASAIWARREGKAPRPLSPRETKEVKLVPHKDTLRPKPKLQKINKDRVTQPWLRIPSGDSRGPHVEGHFQSGTPGRPRAQGAAALKVRAGSPALPTPATGRPEPH